jgi:hypothetical protein
MSSEFWFKDFKGRHNFGDTGVNKKCCIRMDVIEIVWESMQLFGLLSIALNGVQS